MEVLSTWYLTDSLFSSAISLTAGSPLPDLLEEARGQAVPAECRRSSEAEEAAAHGLACF